MTSVIPTTLIAFLGGLLPALLWLWFWLKEDKKNPEPRFLITLAFIAGAVSVIVVIPLEKFALIYFSGPALSLTPIVIISWAIIEESVKFIAGYFTVLRNKEMDEPIDAIIYMIVIALGFAALENTLFISNALSENFSSTLTTGSFRFIGATLLHILSSAVIGGAIALSFYKNSIKKIIYISIGIILSFSIHSSFNILVNSSDNGGLLKIFSLIWAGIILLILFFERVRNIKKKKKIKLKN